MRESQPKNFDHFIQPFVFVLKEGKGIQQNYLDYSLLLLVGKADTIHSPKHYKLSSPMVQLLKR